MDLFLRASTVRLISYNDRFLVADEDCVGVSHGTDRHAKGAVWAVEPVEGKDSIRLRSCHGTYLTASATPVIIPGVTGRRVVQAWPCQHGSATEWEPSRDGMEVRLRSAYGHFLRPNGGLTPWRNAVTHDAPYRGKSREKMLWDVEVVSRFPESSQRRTSVRSRPRPRSRSRSSSASSMDLIEKQDNEAGKHDCDGDGDGDGDEEVYNNVKSWWCAPSCLHF